MRPNPAIVQTFVANSFGIGAIRKMAPAGTLSRVREFLADVDLSGAPSEQARYAAYLNDLTARFVSAMPKGAKHWGMARKCLNLFLRDALYNVYLREKHSLQRFESVMEIPLDSYVGKALKKADQTLPKWPGVIHVDEDVNAKFQAAASKIARDKSTFRVHLDMVYWRAP